MEDTLKYYQILGLKPGATEEEIKQAYRDAVKVWHPDRFEGDLRLQERAQQKLKEINLSYEFLKLHWYTPPPRDEQTYSEKEDHYEEEYYEGEQPVRQRMAAKIFHWLMVIMCIVVSVCLLRVYGEVFRAHLGLFVFLWLLLPFLAFWLASGLMRPIFSTTNLSLVRKVLMSGVIVISISFIFSNGQNYVRDLVGHRFVEGYWVDYHEVEDDTDEYGRPFPFSSIFPAREIHADHWYAVLGLWLVEGSLLIPVIGLPYLTWYACTREERERRKRSFKKWMESEHGKKFE